MTCWWSPRDCSTCNFDFDSNCNAVCIFCKDNDEWKRHFNLRIDMCEFCTEDKCSTCAHKECNMSLPQESTYRDKPPLAGPRPWPKSNIPEPAPKRGKIPGPVTGTQLAGKTFNKATLSKDTDPHGTDAHAPGAKLDAGKTRWSLLPWAVIEGVAKVMTFGAAKYSDGGWKSVPDAQARYYDAMLRHKMLMDSGEYIDPDSGLPHWAHFCCNAVFLGYFYLKDRPKS